MNKEADFTYVISKDGLYRVIPNSPDAIATWNANPFLQIGLLEPQFHAFMQQARHAKYTVRKSSPSKISLDDIFKDLDELGI